MLGKNGVLPRAEAEAETGRKAGAGVCNTTVNEAMSRAKAGTYLAHARRVPKK